MYCVYQHINKVNGKRYIGQTKHEDDPNLRWRNGKHYDGKFRKDIEKYGWHNFEHYIIRKGLTAEEANALERKLILYYMTKDKEMIYNERLVSCKGDNI